MIVTLEAGMGPFLEFLRELFPVPKGSDWSRHPALSDLLEEAAVLQEVRRIRRAESPRPTHTAALKRACSRFGLSYQTIERRFRRDRARQLRTKCPPRAA